MKDKPLTATEIKENWGRKHDVECKCEWCYVTKRIKTIQKAILEPLINKTQELLNGKT